MKRSLLIIGVLFTSQSFAAITSFCSNPTMTYQNGCTSTCSAIAASGNFAMSSNSDGVCMGKATVKNLPIKKIELGRTEIGNESRCQIWKGDDITIDEVSGLGLNSKYPITLSECTAETTYDAMYFTFGRYEDLAGEAVFPNGSGKMVRTTSVFSAKDSVHTDLLNLASWRDLASVDTTKAYTIPNTGSPAWIHKKISSSPSDVDLTSSSNITMYMDRTKLNYSTYTNTTARPGYVCFQNPDLSGLDTNDCVANNDDGTYVTIVPSEYVTGLPLTLKEGDETLDIEYIALKTDRGNNEYHGVQFLWRMDGATLKYVGVQPAEAEGEYSQLGISNIRSNDGL
jgi:hypothetical protein